MRNVLIEERKLNYLLEKANMIIDQLDERYKRIDEMMKKISVGDIIYEYDPFDGAYPQKIIDIIDKEQGIVKVYEESINRVQEGCILRWYLTIEDCLSWTR